MKTSVLKKPSRSTHQTRTQSTEDYWIDAALEPATSTQDPWLIAHSQNLRAPLMAMGSMLDLMELRQKLACVRPLYEEPSDFDEVAFRRVRKNFQCLVQFFNEFADLTGQSPLQRSKAVRLFAPTPTSPRLSMTTGVAWMTQKQNNRAGEPRL
jgi:hypothetical protein